MTHIIKVNGVNDHVLTYCAKKYMTIFSPDINECESEDHGCSQACLNYPGGYFCGCYTGYETVYQLPSRKAECIGEGNSKHLVFSYFLPFYPFFLCACSLLFCFYTHDIILTMTNYQSNSNTKIKSLKIIKSGLRI